MPAQVPKSRAGRHLLYEQENSDYVQVYRDQPPSLSDQGTLREDASSTHSGASASGPPLATENENILRPSDRRAAAVPLLGDSGKPHTVVSQAEVPLKSTTSATYFSVILATAILPLAGLITWLVSMSKEHRAFTTLTGAVLGGHLTQTQAKSIDFVVSALLAPSLMAGLNYIWFACARVCVINERPSSTARGRGISLQVLTTASSQCSGSYSPFVLWTLVNGKTWGLFTLGLIVLASAIGTSALSNIIAYESFSENIPSDQAHTLRLLSDSELAKHPFNDTLDLENGAADPIYKFTSNQQMLAGRNVSSVFNDVKFAAINLDADGGYLGTNTTAASMNAVNASVVTLDNVHGYRLTVNCTPATMVPSSLRLVESELYPTGNNPEYLPVAEYTVVDIQAIISPDLNPTIALTQQGNPFSSQYTFIGSADMFLQISDVQSFGQFPAFYTDPTTTYGLFTLAYFESIDTLVNDTSVPGSNETTETWYADPEGTYQTDFGLTRPSLQWLNTTYEDSTYGCTSQNNGNVPEAMVALQCAIYKQDGLLNFTRQSDQSWAVSSSSFVDERQPYISYLPDWSTHVSSTIFFSSLADVIFGQVVEGSFPNMTSAARNVLYASGEIERIIYNIAAENSSRDRPEYFYDVTGTINQEFYRITYVPALFVVALGCITLCAVLTTALVLAAWNTMSWKMFRQMDPIRLVIDSMSGGMSADVAEFERLVTASDKKIADWAKGYNIKYEKMMGEKEGTVQGTVRLNPVGGRSEES